MNEGLQLILTALGNAIISSFWQTGLLWLLVLLYSKTHRRLSPARLSALSFTALLSGFAAFIITFIVSLSNPHTVIIHILLWTGSSGMPHLLLTGIAVTYTLVLALQVVKLAGGLYKVKQLKTKGLARVPGHLKIFLLDASQYLDIKRKVKLFSSTLVTSPLTIGFFKPVILIPVALLNQLTVREAEAIILHELAHIKRKDYLQNLVTQIILVVLYFNPFAKMLAKMQGLEREKSADNWVMQFEYNNNDYARTLLLLAKQSVDHNNTLAVPMSGKDLPLLERVEWIFGMRIRRQPSLKNMLYTTVAVITALIISFSSLQVVPTETAAAPMQADIPFVAYKKINDVVVPQRNSDVAVVTVAAKRTNSKSPQEAQIPVVEEQDMNMGVEPGQELTPTFVKTIAIVAPSLPESKEQNIREALLATQKIIIETSWEIIEKSLAETVTPEDKEKLKKIYSAKVSVANLDMQASTLRVNYDKINWPQLMDQLTRTIDQLKLDSIYNRYQLQAAELNHYRKEIAGDSTKKEELQVVTSLVQEYKAVISKLDSLRHKKIVEL